MKKKAHIRHPSRWVRVWVRFYVFSLLLLFIYTVVREVIIIVSNVSKDYSINARGAEFWCLVYHISMWDRVSRMTDSIAKLSESKENWIEHNKIANKKIIKNQIWLSTTYYAHAMKTGPKSNAWSDEADCICALHVRNKRQTTITMDECTCTHISCARVRLRK